MYFDNAATTMVPNEIVDIAHYYMRWEYANAGSIHYAGTSIKNKINQARHTIAECIGAGAEQIIFTSGGSESNTLAIVGLINHLKNIGKPYIVSSEIEHPSVLAALDYASSVGINVLKLPVSRDGIVDTGLLKKWVEQYDIGLVSVMAVNNEIGSIQDVEAIGRICRKNNILFHADCVQAIGTVEIDAKKMNIDFLSVSGHKFHAPKGIGFLYARNKELLHPIIFGGGQEYSLRSGTENVPGIMGMAQAMRNEVGDEVYKTHVLIENDSVSRVKKIFSDNVQKLCKEQGIIVHFNGNSKDNKSKIVNLRFPGIDGQTLVLMCSAKGMCISAGSACKSNSSKPSHVLRAIGLSEDEALSSVRVSFSRYNTAQEACDGAGIIVQCVKEMLEGNYDE